MCEMTQIILIFQIIDRIHTIISEKLVYQLKRVMQVVLPKLWVGWRNAMKQLRGPGRPQAETYVSLGE